jgi:hypothetical protein
MSAMGSAEAATPARTSDPSRSIRDQFPMFREERTPPLAYLDSAATSQKPDAVIEAMRRHYAYHNANIHRGVYRLAEEATEAYEDRGCRVTRFINAATPREVVFTRNSTEAINPSRTAGAAPRCVRATRSCSRRWSTTRTSCRGRSSPRSAASSCGSFPSRTTAGSISPRCRDCSPTAT